MYQVLAVHNSPYIRSHYDEGKTNRYFLDRQAEGNVDKYISWELARDKRGPFLGKIRVEYSNEVFMRYDDVINSLQWCEHFRTRLEYSNRLSPTEREANLKEIVDRLYNAIVGAIENDKILEMIISQLHYLSSYDGVDKYLPVFSKQFKNWNAAAIYYSNVLLERRSPVGYFHVMYDKFASGDKRRAIEMAEEVDRLGLGTYDLYKRLGDLAEYVTINPSRLEYTNQYLSSHVYLVLLIYMSVAASHLFFFIIILSYQHP